MNKLSVIKDMLVSILGVALISILMVKFLFFLILVPSGSMYPTIKPGDRVITTRIYNFDNFQRGDILVFRSDEFQENMVKRVIGLPKDSVEIKEDGSVFINGQKLQESYVKYPDPRGGKFTVPEGEYFFLGDNRAHSLDSRSWKATFIPQEKLKGKAAVVVFPFHRISSLD